MAANFSMMVRNRLATNTIADQDLSSLIHYMPIIVVNAKSIMPPRLHFGRSAADTPIGAVIFHSPSQPSNHVQESGCSFIEAFFCPRFCFFFSMAVLDLDGPVLTCVPFLPRFKARVNGVLPSLDMRADRDDVELADVANRVV